MKAKEFVAMRLWDDKPATRVLENDGLQVTPCRESSLLEGVQHDGLSRPHEVAEEGRGPLFNATHPRVIAFLADNPYPLLEGRGFPALDLGGTARLTIKLRGLQSGEGIANSLRQQMLVGHLLVRRTAENATRPSCV
jgi:hypothetical protein